MAVESNAETQYRLQLERTCAGMFMGVRDVVMPCPQTLLLFDFGEPGAFQNVAFKTTLDQAELVGTAESLIASFARNEQRIISAADMRDLRLPPSALFVDVINALKQTVRAGIGFALLLGKGDAVMYGSNANREDVANMIRNDLLPRWRAGIS
jgi:hypothetical protein